MKIALLLFILLNIHCTALDYKKYWNDLYSNGGNSGPGSRGGSAALKTIVVKEFMENKKIDSVVEFGCGDGFNLALINYKKYLGFDISEKAVELCANKFKDDSSKSFMVYKPGFFSTHQEADLVVCLDVLYHIIDELEYKNTLDDIFSFNPNYVILFTTLNFRAYEPDKHPEAIFRNVLEDLIKYKDYEIDIVKQNERSSVRYSDADFIFLTKKTLAPEMSARPS